MRRFWKKPGSSDVSGTGARLKIKVSKQYRTDSCYCFLMIVVCAVDVRLSRQSETAIGIEFAPDSPASSTRRPAHPFRTFLPACYIEFRAARQPRLTPPNAANFMISGTPRSMEYVVDEVAAQREYPFRCTSLSRRMLHGLLWLRRSRRRRSSHPPSRRRASSSSAMAASAWRRTMPTSIAASPPRPRPPRTRPTPTRR